MGVVAFADAAVAVAVAISAHVVELDDGGVVVVVVVAASAAAVVASSLVAVDSCVACAAAAAAVVAFAAVDQLVRKQRQSMAIVKWNLPAAAAAATAECFAFFAVWPAQLLDCPELAG